ncbi:putative vesicle transport through interaction with t-SNAREs 1 [Blattamonas nauphoetae]|uniref:Vesicle transport through interaction with t-SNAREs 1 n=1 Tax=Blattamonas nauphoetae TaxID=2049346 RepID=A0ABQ9YKQ1_9EUKA|nr:putative vesicle transport through interaction with t-SNAREs 1 [Blattamonas nauphoetae]
MNVASKSDWDLYCSEIEVIFKRLKILVEDVPSNTGQERLSLISRITTQFNELDQLIGTLHSILSEVPANKRKRGSEQIQSFENDLSSLRQKVAESGKQFNDTPEMRAALFGTQGGTSATNGRQFLNASNQTALLEEGTSMLDDSVRLTSESIDVASSTLLEMRRQGDVITHARGVNREIGENLGTASRLLRGMLTRAKRNKVITICLIVVIILTIVTILVVIIKKISKGK